MQEKVNKKAHMAAAAAAGNGAAEQVDWESSVVRGTETVRGTATELEKSYFRCSNRCQLCDSRQVA